MDAGVTPQEKKKSGFDFKALKWYEHLFAALPLILMFVGGAIGGALGGMGYWLNGTVFCSKLAKSLKYLFSFLITIGVVVLYVIVVALLIMAFPGLCKK